MSIPYCRNRSSFSSLDDVAMTRAPARCASCTQAMPTPLVPDGCSLDHAACVPVSWGTANDCLFEFGQLQAGETVLVQAGTSGVGIACVQLAHRAGARVIATSSSDEK